MRLPQGFEYRASYLAGSEADALLSDLWHDLDWRQYPIRMFGKSLLQPRLTAWCSDPGIRYRYSGTQLSPTPWHPGLAALRRRLKSDLEAHFNSVLVNAYRDGRDAMGWHADNEPELGDEPLIASVSLGQARKLRIRPRAGGNSIGCLLEHGSLLLMSGRSQADWAHAVPRTKKPLGLRINLTFRTIF